MKLSKYVRRFPWNGAEQVLFNTANRAIVLLPLNYFDNNSATVCVPASELTQLEEMGFFDEHAAFSLLTDSFEHPNKLIISVEITRLCNLRCPYCYQISNDSSFKPGFKKIETKHLESLLNYLESVYQVAPYQQLSLKILGGEPTLAWKQFVYTLDGAKRFCEKYNVSLNIALETNGVIINPIIEIDDSIPLLAIIPLSHKRCHDSLRRARNGRGTYDTIMENIKTLHEVKPNIIIILRHNTDHENLPLFAEYIKDLEDKLPFSPTIVLNYTMELGDGGYRNHLPCKEFVDWVSSDAIEILINSSFPVTITPLLSLEPCQHTSKYSMKMFSDGTVGSCAMSFSDKQRPSILDINEASVSCIKGRSILDEPRCLECESIFLCGGAYSLPCLMPLGMPKCEKDGAFNLNLEKFIQTYMKYALLEREHLFVGFNGTSTFT